MSSKKRVFAIIINFVSSSLQEILRNFTKIDRDLIIFKIFLHHRARLRKLPFDLNFSASPSAQRFYTSIGRIDVAIPGEKCPQCIHVQFPGVVDIDADDYSGDNEPNKILWQAGRSSNFLTKKNPPGTL